MKKFIAYVFMLVAIVVALALVNDCIVALIAKRTESSSAYKMWRLYGGNDSDEIAILGSSRAQNCYVPSMISTNCFNYGISGCGVKELTAHVVAMSKRHGRSPVIINIDPWGLFSRKMVGDYRLAPESGMLSWADGMPGIRFHGTLRPMLNRWMNERTAAYSIVDNGAILFKEQRSAKEWEAINKREEAMSFRMESKIESDFCDAIRSLAPRKAIIVVCPCSTRFMELFTGCKELDAFLSRLSEIDNVAVANYLGSDDFSDSDFIDTKHLTLEGARKFSTKLARDVLVEDR